MKISGAEWKLFESRGWPPGYIWGDESHVSEGVDLYKEDGSIIFADTDTFTVPSWWFVTYEGPEGKVTDSGEGHMIRHLIRKWRKEESTETLVLEIPKDSAEAAKALFASKGWKLVT